MINCDSLQELRRYLEFFKQSGKFSISYMYTGGKCHPTPMWAMIIISVDFGRKILNHVMLQGRRSISWPLLSQSTTVPPQHLSPCVDWQYQVSTHFATPWRKKEASRLTLCFQVCLHLCYFYHRYGSAGCVIPGHCYGVCKACL